MKVCLCLLRFDIDFAMALALALRVVAPIVRVSAGIDGRKDAKCQDVVFSV